MEPDFLSIALDAAAKHGGKVGLLIGIWIAYIVSRKIGEVVETLKEISSDLKFTGRETRQLGERVEGKLELMHSDLQRMPIEIVRARQGS